MHSNKFLFAALVLLAACSTDKADDLPLVMDDAALLSGEQRERVALFHGFLLGDFDIDYRVVTTLDGGDIDRFAVARFAELEAGSASRGGHGLLLVIDPAADRVRLEVGYALEGTFPDAFVAYIEQRQMVPFFAASRVADGILATTELIVDRAQKAVANASLASEVRLEGSGGAGAATVARIDAGVEPPAHGPDVAASNSPEATLAGYFRAMSERNAAPDLGIYTPATRDMLAAWVVTPAQMDNIVTTFRRCQPEPARVSADGGRAVIRYPVAERQCSPWFFERVGAQWALDLTMMQRAIRFGRDNSWHFVAGHEHPYEFAFDDWRLDADGYPHARR